MCIRDRSGTTQITATTEYGATEIGSTSASVGDIQSIAGNSCTQLNGILTVENAPGVGNSWSLVLLTYADSNYGSATSSGMTTVCTISGTSTSCTGASVATSIGATDALVTRLVASGAVTATKVGWNFQCSNP